MNTVF